MRFTEHTVDTAPPAARRGLRAVQQHLGHLPPAAARMATSPQLLEGFQRLSALFETADLPPLARETLIMTVAVRNGCHVCIDMHSEKLRALDAPPEMITALARGEALDDPALEAIRRFTRAALDHHGDVPDPERITFERAGYTARHALEVMLGIGAYTLSTYANRLTRA